MIIIINAECLWFFIERQNFEIKKVKFFSGEVISLSRYPQVRLSYPIRYDRSYDFSSKFGRYPNSLVLDKNLNPKFWGALQTVLLEELSLNGHMVFTPKGSFWGIISLGSR